MTTKTLLAAVFTIGLASAALTGSVGAQVAQEGGPVMVGGDSWHADENALTQVWDGRVEVVQADSRLRADHVVITHAPGGEGENKGWGEVVKIEASGNVYYVTPENTVKGNTAVYTKAEDTMVISGDVVLKQGKNVMTGTRLVAAIGAGTTTMDAAPGSTNNGRVRAVLYPDEKQANSAAGN